MANALSSLGGPPPAPNPQPQQTGNNGPMPMPALSGGGGQPPPQGQQQGQQQQAPPPSHQQTVAALRHFGAIERELRTILEDPGCGKSDMKSKVIDGATALVSEGITAPGDAVKDLATFPEQPFQQKQWLMQKLQMMQQAQVAILDHHRAGVQADPSLGAVQDYDPADHANIMNSVISQYKGAQGAG